MAGDTVWGDFDHFCTVYLPRQTVARLRQFSEIIQRLAGMYVHLKNQERKSIVVDKVRNAFEVMKRNNQSALYIQVRRECEQLGAQVHRGLPPPTFGGVTVPSASKAPAGAPRPAAAAPSGSRASGSWSSPGASASAATHKPRQMQLQDWKQSPMWKPRQALTNMEPLPDIGPNESSHSRRDKRVYFTLSQDIINLLNKNKTDPRSRPIYSVRVFCTSSEHFRPQGMPAQYGVTPPSNRSIPIEYPNNPDVTLDDYTVPFKERGLRGKAGSAPPLDLDKGSRGLARVPGRMMNLVMGHQGPTLSKNKSVSKKFYFQVVFCEITSMEDLLARLETLVPTDAAAELDKLRKRAAGQDEIQVGTSTLSLKDPLSGMRITKPIRSSQCSHLQCFDARWWLESNKNHPQWICPHCSKELSLDSIICDGYFFSILRKVPESVDEVTLEANGEWHTQDNQYYSSGWVPPASSAPTAMSTPGVSAKRERSPTPDASTGKRRAIQVLSDSEDEDGGGTRESSRPNGNGNYASVAPSGPSRASSSIGVTPAVIDLTLSSDEEDERPSRPASGTSGAHRQPPEPSPSQTVQSSIATLQAIARQQQQQQSHPNSLQRTTSRPETPSSPFSAQLLAGLDRAAAGSGRPSAGVPKVPASSVAASSAPRSTELPPALRATGQISPAPRPTIRLTTGSSLPSLPTARPPEPRPNVQTLPFPRPPIPSPTAQRPPAPTPSATPSAPTPSTPNGTAPPTPTATGWWTGRWNSPTTHEEVARSLERATSARVIRLGEGKGQASSIWVFVLAPSIQKSSFAFKTTTGEVVTITRTSAACHVCEQNGDRAPPHAEQHCHNVKWWR